MMFFKEAHPLLTHDWQIALRLVQPFLVQSGVATQDELDILYARVCEEMSADQFCAVIYFQTVWGKKEEVESYHYHDIN